MKKWALIAFGALFSLMFGFTCIGYAALSTDLTIEGSASWTMPEIVLITDVARDSENPGDGTWNESATSYASSILTSSVTLDSTSSTVSLAITVYNNTNVVQGLDAVLSEADFYSNPNITYTLTNLSRPVTKITTTNGKEEIEEIPGTQIQPDTYHTFFIAFSYKRTDSSNSSLSLDSTLDFVFKPYEDIVPDEEKMVIIEGALAQFERILNDDDLKNADGDTYYDLLLETMNDKSGHQQSYIGNVVGADDNDSETLEELFAGKLTMNIDGEARPVTVMIKRENIDGDSSTGLNYTRENGCEMTLYITAETITGANRSITVYAAVFTIPNGETEWVQFGETYKGTATTNRYSGWPWGTDYSFNTDTWSASVDYYGVKAGDGATIEAITSAYKATQTTN